MIRELRRAFVCVVRAHSFSFIGRYPGRDGFLNSQPALYRGIIIRRLRRTRYTFCGGTIYTSKCGSMVRLERNLRSTLAFSDPERIGRSRIGFGLYFVRRYLYIIGHVSDVTSHCTRKLLTRLFRVLANLHLRVITTFSRFRFLISRIYGIML